jgi:hypothetical protein
MSAKHLFRKSTRGQIVFSILAQWVAGRLARSGMTLPQWAAKGYKLNLIGINKRSALAELKPLIPLAHEWYNEHGDSRNRYAIWEDYWKVLFNRMFYFFHRHNDAGQGPLAPAVAEWPGKISEDGLSLIPPALPEGTADHPGTGYPEDAPGNPDRPGTGYPEEDPGEPDESDEGGNASQRPPVKPEAWGCEPLKAAVVVCRS